LICSQRSGHSVYKKYRYTVKEGICSQVVVFSFQSRGAMLNGLDGNHDFGDVKTWMFLDSDEWSNLQKSAQNASETLEKLEGIVKNGYSELSKKISEIGRSLLLKFH